MTQDLFSNTISNDLFDEFNSKFQEIKKKEYELFDQLTFPLLMKKHCKQNNVCWNCFKEFYLKVQSKKIQVSFNIPDFGDDILDFLDKADEYAKDVVRYFIDLEYMD